MKQKLSLLLILAIYLAIALGYGVINPLFEAPDEHRHFFTAVYIAENHRLPFVAENHDLLMGQEAAQPPLAYMLFAALISPVDLSTAREDIWYNPFGTQGLGNAEALTNRNLFIHGRAEQWPWAGYVLAAHLLRIFTTLLGLGTLLGIFGSARLLWPDNPAKQLLPTALAAFLPQFCFQHATISNDALIIFLCTTALWQLIWLWQTDISITRLLGLGITIGLAALSKNAGVLLLFFAVGFLALRHWQTAVSWQTGWARWLWQTAVTIVLPVLLIAGWLWWRNWQLYDDWTATNQFIRLSGGDRAFTLGQVLAESGGLWRSLFAIFGWANLLAPAWVYWIWNGLALVGLVGFLRTGMKDWLPIRHLNRQSLITNALPILLAGWVLTVYAGLMLFMLRTPAAQGRLLFPALVPLALGLATGLIGWHWRPLLWLAPVLALLTTVYCLFGVIRPAYQLPVMLDSLPATATPLNEEMGAGLWLRGVAMETETAVPDSIVWFTFYWQADTVPDRPPELVIDLLGRDHTPIGSSRGYHGRGMFPASEWPADRIIADRMGVRVTDEVAAPVLAQLHVRLADRQATAYPTQFVGAVKIVPTTWPKAAGIALAEVDGRVQVTAVSIAPQQAHPGDVITINIEWQVTAPPQANWTALVHLAELGQPPVATGDSPPLHGDYPTGIWAAGEIFIDQYHLTIPDGLANGRYPLWLGMYHSVNGERLPLTINGEAQPNQITQIGEIEVLAP